MLPLIKHSAFVFTPPQLIVPDFFSAGTVAIGGPSNSFTLSPTFPSNMMESDLIVGVVVGYNRVSTASGVPVIGFPSNWIAWPGSSDQATSGATSFNARGCKIMYRFHRGAADTGSVSIAVRAPGQSTEISAIGNVFVYRGVRLLTPIDESASFTHASGDQDNQFITTTTRENYCMAVRYSVNGSNVNLSSPTLTGGLWTNDYETNQGPFSSTTGDAYYGMAAESYLVPTQFTVVDGGVTEWSAGQAMSCQGMFLPVFGGGSAIQNKPEYE